MSGFFSWISGLLSRKPVAAPVASASEPRLFNPADADSPGHQSTDSDLIVQLEENLFCWLLDVEPGKLKVNVDGANEILAKLERRIENRHLDELPHQPATLPQLLKALSGETIERSKISSIILSDPKLTEQLLQVANSPFFRHGHHYIESVDQAVFVLGLNGIRSVTAAAVMRPMMAARNSREALFAQRTWRWALSCARAAEMVARKHGEDTSAYFVVGLLPGLAYLTIRRELFRICRARGEGMEPEPALLRAALAQQQWAVCQRLANEWKLPPKYHAWLLYAERPAPKQRHSAVTDGLLLGSREILRHAHQRSLPEQELYRIIDLPPAQITEVRNALVAMLEEGRTSTSRV
ncbi:MAG: HDOD domain-containing protein [Marinobacter sp.]